ncbi:hypothetical protein BOO69_13395 [Sulfitobacter alexandrii]|uniref:Uncharacterized protein n=1 Tax=Sulfitobacter alexandrii TaxID=1917485 RepID=A0A1J0WIY5_9RHOB|nr:hypothetical protein BOO69_13395 [Sulfitobacter alexandrii]
MNTWGVARYAGTPDALKRWRDRMERKRNVKVHDTEFRALEIARRDLRKLRSRYIDRSSDPQGADRRLQIAKHGNLPRDMCDGKFRYQEFDRFD